MPFDPFALPGRFSEKQVRQLFGAGSNAALANKTRIENAPLYEEIRAQAAAMGLVAGREVPAAKPDNYNPATGRATPQNLSIEDHALLEKLGGIDAVTSFWKGSGDKHRPSNVNITAVSMNSPELYADFKRAGQLLGYLADASGVVRVPTKEQLTSPPEGAVAIPAELAARIAALRNFNGTPVAAGQFVTAEKLANIESFVKHAESVQQ